MFLCKFKKNNNFRGGSGRSPSPSRSTHRGTELKVNGECTLRLYSTHNGQLINYTYREISELLKTIYISWSEYKNVATYAQVDFNEIWDKYLGCFSSYTNEKVYNVKSKSNIVTFSVPWVISFRQSHMPFRILYYCKDIVKLVAYMYMTLKSLNLTND